MKKKSNYEKYTFIQNETNLSRDLSTDTKL